MTRATNARVAGFTQFFYFAVGIASLGMAGSSHVTGVLTLSTSLSALVLGVTFYSITREQDRDLAMLALTCRIIEGIPGDLGGMGEIYSAMGTTLFSWLLLRGRLIPVALAWFGVLASGLLVIILPLWRSGLFGGPMTWSDPVTWFVHLPLLVFELGLASWLLIKGVAIPATR